MPVIRRLSAKYEIRAHMMSSGVGDWGTSGSGRSGSGSGSGVGAGSGSGSGSGSMVSTYSPLDPCTRRTHPRLAQLSVHR